MHWIDTLLRISIFSIPILIDVAVKGLIALCVAGLLTLAMRRASAAMRHLVWCLAAVSLLALPVLSTLLPAWHILPAWTVVPSPPCVPVTRRWSCDSKMTALDWQAFTWSLESPGSLATVLACAMTHCFSVPYRFGMNHLALSVSAIDANGSEISRLPEQFGWTAWPSHDTAPPNASLGDDQFDYRMESRPPIHHESWFRGTFNGESLDDFVNRWLIEFSRAVEHPYVLVGRAWLDWHDGKTDEARSQLTQLAAGLPLRCGLLAVAHPPLGGPGLPSWASPLATAQPDGIEDFDRSGRRWSRRLGKPAGCLAGIREPLVGEERRGEKRREEQRNSSSVIVVRYRPPEEGSVGLRLRATITVHEDEHSARALACHFVVDCSGRSPAPITACTIASQARHRDAGRASAAHLNGPHTELPEQELRKPADVMQQDGKRG